MHNLIAALSQEYDIVNKQSSLGLLDLLLRLPKTDIIYLNWIEDIAGKRLAIFQAMLFFLIIFLAKAFQIKIIWFVHNNISHFKKNLWLKKIIVAALAKHADVVIAHSREVTLNIPACKFHSFDHPLEAYNPLESAHSPAYDLLIWGTVSAHKGVKEFLKFNYSSPELSAYRILIAGKFQSQAYYESLRKFLLPNIIIDNKILTEAELEEYFRTSRYVLFTYNSASVLSSAALCKTLSYGKSVIGPARGSFKDLAKKGLIYNYEDFKGLSILLEKLKDQKNILDEAKLKKYIQANSWSCFAEFVIETINAELKTMVPLVSRS